ncbi:MAG: hypothetical protein GF330_08010 [Candidatus Eisenbacteria bacterium]|nr:hypothetical protein [Candidatus Eisenbacteria bacterium]
MGVRIDALLHWLCLQKSRSMAARGCREGEILLNGRAVRPAKEVRVGDWISLAQRGRERWISVEILALPARQVSRAGARDYYRPLQDADRPVAEDPDAERTRPGGREGRA